MELKELQEKLDAEKWLASEKAGKDVCGEFDYCAKCDKEAQYPCAAAYTAFAAEKTEAKSAEKAEVKPAAKTEAKSAQKKPAAKRNCRKAK